MGSTGGMSRRSLLLMSSLENVRSIAADKAVVDHQRHELADRAVEPLGRQRQVPAVQADGMDDQGARQTAGAGCSFPAQVRQRNVGGELGQAEDGAALGAVSDAGSGEAPGDGNCRGRGDAAAGGSRRAGAAPDSRRAPACASAPANLRELLAPGCPCRPTRPPPPRARRGRGCGAAAGRGPGGDVAAPARRPDPRRQSPWPGNRPPVAGSGPIRSGQAPGSGGPPSRATLNHRTAARKLCSDSPTARRRSVSNPCPSGPTRFRTRRRSTSRP